MIKKLKRKFIILATVSMLVLMVLLVGAMNVINYLAVVAETDSILDMLTQPNAPFMDAQSLPFISRQEIRDFVPRGMSPETPYEARYFTARVTKSGAIEASDISRIVSVDSASVDAYVRKATVNRKERGFVGQFRYVKQTEDKGTRLMFLDCGRKLDSYRRFMWTSIGVGLIGWASVFVVFVFASGRFVRPIALSYDKQKRFITDAGHEIKTPLTVISANLDLMESDLGDNECLADIRAQTKRLSALTGDLVYLARMEEAGDRLKKIDFPVSDLITETAAGFRAVAQARETEYRVDVEKDIDMRGAPDSIRQLVTILIDNAMKYSPEGGIVTVEAAAQRRELHISVFNTTADALTADDISRIFDRFYRADASRSSETGGHGIGLSVAQAITEAHGGKISAATQTGSDFRINVTLPL